MNKQRRLSAEDFRAALFDDIKSDLKHDSRFNAADIKAIQTYYKNGSLEDYLDSGQKVAARFVYYLFPEPSLSEFQQRLETYWNWVLEDPTTRKDPFQDSSETPDQQFMRPFAHLFEYGYVNFFPAELSAEVFHWVYGEQYSESRVLPVSLGPDEWRPRIVVDINSLCTRIMVKIDSYLFPYNESQYHNHERFKYLADYMLSLVLHLDKECYATSLFDRWHKIDGRRSGYRAYQIRIRTFLSHLNGILTKHDKEDGVKKLVDNDHELLEHVKKATNNIDIPELAELNKFVLRHRSAAVTK